MIKATPAVKSFHVSFSPSTELDVVGYVIHAVHQNDLVEGDFIPSSSNLINNGPETSYFHTVDVPGIWAIKIAAYDSFEDFDAIDYPSLNYSALVTVGVIDDALLLPPALYDELRTDFITNNIRFWFGDAPYAAANAAVLHWDGSTGSFIKGTEIFTLTTPVGTFAAANGKYVIATLDRVTKKAVLSLTNISDGAPILIPDSEAQFQRVVAITSISPPQPGCNNVAYVRQANSMELEAALIRNLTVQADAVIGGTLVIGGTNGVAITSNSGAFQVDTDGVLTCTGANITGEVHMGPGSTITWDKITDAPTTIGPTGIYTGTLTATQVNAVDISASSIKTGTMQSTNYVLNSSGWKLGMNGTGELQSVKVRGDVEASSLKANTIMVQSAHIAGHAITIPRSGSGGVSASCDITLPETTDVLIIATTGNTADGSTMKIRRVTGGGNNELIASSQNSFGSITQTALDPLVPAGTHTYIVEGGVFTTFSTISVLAVLR